MTTECPECHNKQAAGGQPYTCQQCGCVWTEKQSKRHGLIKEIEILEIGKAKK